MGLLNWLKKLGQEDDLKAINALDIRKDMDTEKRIKSAPAPSPGRLQKVLDDIDALGARRLAAARQHMQNNQLYTPCSAGPPGIVGNPGNIGPIKYGAGGANTAVTGTGGGSGLTQTVIIKDEYDLDSILKKLRGMGYHLTGSRRMLAKYKAEFTHLDLADEQNRIGQIRDKADWDLFIATDKLITHLGDLEEMGFELVIASSKIVHQFTGFPQPQLQQVDSGRTMYNDKMTQCVLRHPIHPIEITGKTHEELYMKTFESISFAEYVATLWKSNPLIGFYDLAKHKAYISHYYDNAFYRMACALDMPNAKAYGTKWDQDLLIERYKEILGETNYVSLLDSYSKTVAKMQNL